MPGYVWDFNAPRGQQLKRRDEYEAARQALAGTPERASVSPESLRVTEVPSSTPSLGVGDLRRLERDMPEAPAPAEDWTKLLSGPESQLYPQEPARVDVGRALSALRRFSQESEAKARQYTSSPPERILGQLTGGFASAETMGLISPPPEPQTVPEKLARAVGEGVGMVGPAGLIGKAVGPLTARALSRLSPGLARNFLSRIAASAATGAAYEGGRAAVDAAQGERSWSDVPAEAGKGALLFGGLHAGGELAEQAALRTAPRILGSVAGRIGTKAIGQGLAGAGIVAGEGAIQGKTPEQIAQEASLAGLQYGVLGAGFGALGEIGRNPNVFETGTRNPAAEGYREWKPGSGVWFKVDPVTGAFQGQTRLMEYDLVDGKPIFKAQVWAQQQRRQSPITPIPAETPVTSEPPVVTPEASAATAEPPIPTELPAPVPEATKVPKRPSKPKALEPVAPSEIPVTDTGKPSPAKPEPARTRNIFRGKGGPVRVVFENPTHAALFDFAGKLTKAAKDGKPFDAAGTEKLLRHWLQVPEGASVADLSNQYRQAVMGAVKGLKAGEVFHAPVPDIAKQKIVEAQAVPTAQTPLTPSAPSKPALPELKPGQKVKITGKDKTYTFMGMKDKSLAKLVTENGTEFTAGVKTIVPIELPKTPAAVGRETVPDTYQEAQDRIDAYEDELIKKYGETAVLNAPIEDDSYYQKLGVPKPETPLTEPELATLKSLYAQRDTIGKADDTKALNEVLSRIPKEGPATPEMVTDALKQFQKGANLEQALGNVRTRKPEDFARELYVSLSHKLVAAGKLPADFAGDLELALQVARDFPNTVYGVSPEPLLRQVASITKAIFGEEGIPGAVRKEQPRSALPAPKTPQEQPPAQPQTEEPVAKAIPSKEPWEMTRAEFHKGRNLHGSFANPEKGRAKTGDLSGFFTADTESHANFYANSDVANPEANKGDIYAAEPPKNPLDLRTDKAGIAKVAQAFETDATRLENDYLDGKTKKSPARMVGAVAELKRLVESGAPAGQIDGAMRNVAIEHGNLEGRSIDTSYYNKVLRDLGYDSFITQETNPATREPGLVTVYLDKPRIVSHRQAVEKALAEGKPVPSEVLKDYPELAASRTAKPVQAPSTTLPTGGVSVPATETEVAKPPVPSSAVKARASAQATGVVVWNAYGIGEDKGIMDALQAKGFKPTAEFGAMMKRLSYLPQKSDSPEIKAKGYAELAQILKEALDAGAEPFDNKVTAHIASLIKWPEGKGPPKREGRAQGFAGSRPATGPSSGPQPLKPMQRKALVDWLGKKFDVVLSKGHFRERALGIYKVKPEVVRTRAWGDIQVLAHEIGHHLDKQLGLESLGHGDELLKLGRATSKKSYTLAQKRKEGVAEFLRLYLGDPAKAKQEAPNFYTAFEQRISQEPEVAKVVSEAQDHISAALRASPADEIDSAISWNNKGKPIGERVQNLPEAVTRARNWIVDEWFDSNAAVLRAQRRIAGKQELPPDMDAYLRLNLLPKMVPGRTEAKLHEWQEAMKPLGDKVEDYFRYADARAVLWRADKFGYGNEKLPFSREAAETYIREHETPEFRKAFEAEQKMFNGALEELKDAGILNDEAIAKIRAAHEDYVPLFRDVESRNRGTAGTGRTAVNLPKGVLRQHGGGEPLLDPVERRIRYFARIIGIAERNRVGRALAKFAKTFEDAGQLMDEIPQPVEMVQVKGEWVMDALEKVGVNTGELDPFDVISFFRPKWASGKNDTIITVWEDGKAHYYDVHDPGVLRAVATVDPVTADIVGTVIQSLASTYRVGATITPSFTIANLIRDTGESWFLSKHQIVPGQAFFGAMKRIVTKDPFVRDVIEAGLKQGGWLRPEKQSVQILREIANPKGARISFRTLWKLYQETRAQPEFWTRLGEAGLEYEARLKKGNSEETAFLRALYEGGRITLNFTRGGYTARRWNRWIPFFKIPFEAAYRAYEAATEHPGVFFTKVILGTTSMALLISLLSKDNEQYRQASEFERDRYFLIPMGKALFRLPKPNGIFAVLENLVERSLFKWREEDPNAFHKFAKNALAELTPRVSNPTMELIVTLATGQPLDSDFPIVPKREENLPPEQQYDSKTSPTVRALTPKGMSPRVAQYGINRLIPGYSEGFFMLEDWIRRGVSGENRPALKPEEYPVVGRFISRPGEGKQGRSVDLFYEELDKAEKLYAGLRAAKSKGEPLPKLSDEDKARLRRLKVLQTTSEVMSKLRKARGAIEASKTLSPERKRTGLERINLMMTNLARRALEEKPKQAAGK